MKAAHQITKKLNIPLPHPSKECVIVELTQDIRHATTGNVQFAKGSRFAGYMDKDTFHTQYISSYSSYPLMIDKKTNIFKVVKDRFPCPLTYSISLKQVNEKSFTEFALCDGDRPVAHLKDYALHLEFTDLPNTNNMEMWEGLYTISTDKFKLQGILFQYLQSPFSYLVSFEQYWNNHVYLKADAFPDATLVYLSQQDKGTS